MKDEFVRVPRSELARLQESMDPPRGAVAWGIVCDLLAKPAAQHQGEPVKTPARDESLGAAERDEYANGYRHGWNAYNDEIAKLGPLYTHADPGEVEHDAVLVSRNPSAESARLLSRAPFRILTSDKAVADFYREVVEASVAAPVESDERAAFEKRFGTDTWSHPDYTDELIGWRMRAALERNNQPKHEQNRKNAERYVWLRDNADASWEGWFVKERGGLTGAVEADREVDERIARERKS